MAIGTFVATLYLFRCMYYDNCPTDQSSGQTHLSGSVLKQEVSNQARSDMTQEAEEIHQPQSTSVVSQYVNAPVPDNPEDRYQCVNYSKVWVGDNLLTFPMCVYQGGQDKLISRSIATGKGWDVANVEKILENLGEPRSDMGFIDLGSNLGTYALAAAAAGHQVVAVEPMDANLRRLKQSIKLGNVKDKVTVVQAGISNQTDKLYFLIHRKNKGASYLVPKSRCHTNAARVCNKNRTMPIILMNDLLDVIPFKNAVLKIDIEGHECRALPKAGKFFDTINIKFIRMEFAWYTRKWKTDAQVKEVNEMISFMKNKGYTPWTDKGDSLEDIKWRHWTDDIVWKK